MRNLSRATLVALAASSAIAAPKSAPGTPDPRAVAIADQVMEALGSKDAWGATRYLRFDFAVDVDGKRVVSRAHTWDKWTGRYRLEGTTKEGEAYLILMNVDTKQGSAWLKGRRLSGEEEKKYLEKGYAVWVNDTYWLIMPYKMRDPGVILSLAGEEKTAEGTWDKLLLTFENVGLTPKDRYWVFVNRATHLVDRWDYVLQGEPGPATTFLWKGWRRYGKVMLAPDRENAKEKEKILFPVLDAPASVPDAVFTAP